MKYKILSNRSEEYKQFDIYELVPDEIRVLEETRKAREYRGSWMDEYRDRHKSSWYERELNKFSAFVSYYIEQGYEPQGELKYFETKEQVGSLKREHKVFMQIVIKRT